MIGAPRQPGRSGLRVTVTGATGNLGVAVMEVLRHEPAIGRLRGLARRVPEHPPPDVEYRAVDLAHAPLGGLFDDTDVLVHLAWSIQPSRRPQELWRQNTLLSARTFAAARAAGVEAIVHASSVGVYSPAAVDSRPVDETWPSHGIATSPYSLAKAYVERLLDELAATPGEPSRIVTLRPALILGHRAASRVRRLFLGPLFPGLLLRPGVLPVFPVVDGLGFQVVHRRDVAEAVRLAILRDVRGPFNLAAPGRLDLRDLADLVRARPVPLPARLARAIAAGSHRLRLHPADVGWFDVAMQTPLLASHRARSELGWQATSTGRQTLAEMLDGLATGAGATSPPLRADRPRRRLRELAGRQGGAEIRP